jgi:hypothetical protein
MGSAEISEDTAAQIMGPAEVLKNTDETVQTSYLTEDVALTSNDVDKIVEKLMRSLKIFDDEIVDSIIKDTLEAVKAEADKVVHEVVSEYERRLNILFKGIESEVARLTSTVDKLITHV